MKYHVVVLCILISSVVAQTDCPTAPSNPQDRRTDKSKLTVTTFNAEWLFYGGARSNCPGSGCPWSDDQEALDHLNKIADVIKQLDSDIVTVVEVESCAVLQKVIDRVGGGKYPYQIQLTPIKG